MAKKTIFLNQLLGMYKTRPFFEWERSTAGKCRLAQAGQTLKVYPANEDATDGVVTVNGKEYRPITFSVTHEDLIR